MAHIFIPHSLQILPSGIRRGGDRIPWRLFPTLSTMDFCKPKLTVLKPLLRDGVPEAETNSELLMWNYPPEVINTYLVTSHCTQWSPLWKVPHFVLTGIEIFSGNVFAFPTQNYKVPFMNLQNTLFTVIEFHKSLELPFQKAKQCNGPALIVFPGFTKFLRFLKTQFW